MLPLVLLLGFTFAAVNASSNLTCKNVHTPHYECGRTGKLVKAKAVRHMNAAAFEDCLSACLTSVPCVSLGYGQGVCTLYSETLSAQGFQVYSSSRVAFWNRHCFSCSPTNPRVVTVAAPAQTITVTAAGSISTVIETHFVTTTATTTATYAYTKENTVYKTDDITKVDYKTDYITKVDYQTEYKTDDITKVDYKTDYITKVDYKTDYITKVDYQTEYKTDYQTDYRTEIEFQTDYKTDYYTAYKTVTQGPQ